jgi:hypothetical protein
VGEVDELQHAVDHCVAEGDRREEEPADHAVDDHKGQDRDHLLPEAGARAFKRNSEQYDDQTQNNGAADNKEQHLPERAKDLS